MTDKIPSGAYVIRNLHSLTVLHIETATLDSGRSRVLAFEQDENRYRDNQVWWIEPLSDPEDDKEGVLYSITNTACGKILDEDCSFNVCAAKPHGAPWQAWRIRRVESCDEGVCYTITGTRAGWVLNIKTPATDPEIGSKNPAIDTLKNKALPESGAMCHTQKYIPGCNQHCWEFVIPIVSFPVGWFQIQNCATGDLLCHKYPYNPPVLLPPPATTHPSQHLESWGTQWTLAQVGTILPGYKYTTGKNTWYILNRLTGGRLKNQSYTSKTGQVVAWVREWSNPAELVWKLELDPASNWTIMHHNTSLLLEQTEAPRGGGTELACLNKRSNLGTRNRTWVFTPPMLDKHDQVRVRFQWLGNGYEPEKFFVPKGLTVEVLLRHRCSRRMRPEIQSPRRIYL